jgi:hypothetical protein
MDNQLKKEIALINELESSVKLILRGLGELQNLSKNEYYYFLPFQLLSQGFERFMKCYICFGYLHKEGKYPNRNYLKNNLGHDLLTLINEISVHHFHNNQHPMLISDYDFLTNNIELRELLSILSEFGKQARYYNFDIITSENDIPNIDPEAHWRSFEHRILMSRPKLIEKLTDFDFSYEVQDEIIQYIVILFEKFMVSLSRQCLHGCIGDKAKQYSTSIYDFTLLFRKGFGVTDYRKKTTRFNEVHLNIHKRTIFDYFNRKFNSKYRSKRINKHEFEGKWPFYADEIVVECRDNHWCIITINGYDYSLNGAAKGKYKLENPHDAGMAILGAPISEFTAISRKL